MLELVAAARSYVDGPTSPDTKPPKTEDPRARVSPNVVDISKVSQAFKEGIRAAQITRSAAL